MATAVFTSFIQCTDDNGDPVNAGSVTVYEDGTTTPISLFSDDGLSIGVANPITLNSDGRHAVRYFSTQAYKVVLKDSGGSTIETWDDIDPGVPVGTGTLPVANGGTNASTAAAARTNLGAAGAAEVAALSAQVAALAGSAASTEKTHIATGTTAQRPSSPIEGDMRRNSQTGVWELYNGSAYQNIVLMPTGQTDPSATDSAEGLIELAIQSEMETGTDVVRAVTPGRQHFHKGHPKVIAYVTGGGTPSLNATVSYNVTSITDSGTGILTVTIATDFSGAEFAGLCTLEDAAGGAVFPTIDAGTVQAGAVVLQSWNVTPTLTDPTSWHFAAWGDHA